MYCVRKIQEDLFWVGGNDRRLNLFESVYPIPMGISYNAYLLLDEKAVLFDTVDHSVSTQLFENLDHLLAERPLDYVVVNHMEPDHAATLGAVLNRFPQATVVTSAKAEKMIHQFFDVVLAHRLRIVQQGDVLETGRHKFTFAMAPMVHWPEVMVTYDLTDGILFSADAFGTFGAIEGSIFADECKFDMDEARRYYTNIVGKYGTQVMSILRKAAKLDIKMICPLHGPVWRRDMGKFIDKYVHWATYTPEENGVLIAYASVYGGTENAASILAARLAEMGVTNVRMYDVSITHASYLVSEAFLYSHIVFASTTYNSGIFVNMENLLHDIAAHNLCNRTVAFLENGTWAATSAKKMRDLLSGLKGTTFLSDTVSLKSTVKQAQNDAITALARAIADSMPKEQPIDHSEKVENNALFSLSYGLFVLTARDGNKDNGCIINTVTQVTDTPKRITIAVNKQNLTHDMILKTGLFNVSVLSTRAPMEVFRHFGFQSGRTVDKFQDVDLQRAENGVCYVPWFSNAYVSGKVIQTIDAGTHTIFLADVTQAVSLNREPSCTYAYYFENIKPKPQPQLEDAPKKGYVCKICGYVYEGDELPPDFICPLCKHGAEDFEKIGG